MGRLPDHVEPSPRLFVDTSAFYAYINRADPDFEAVSAVIDEASLPLITSTYVFDELITLAHVRLGHDVAVQAGRVVRHASMIHVERVTAADEAEAWALFQERPDKRYSFTDCTSFVLMRRLGLKAALTTDVHFRQEGFVVRP